MNKHEIKKLRTRLKLSQTAFAAELGVNRSAICKWESGANPPVGRNLRKLRELAGIDQAIKEQMEQIRRKVQGVARFAGDHVLKSFASDIFKELQALEECLNRRI